MRIYPVILTCFLASASLLQGCATSNVLSMASLALTGKGMGDHALSVTTGQDCAMMNLIQEAELCALRQSANMSLLLINPDFDQTYQLITPTELLATDKIDMAEHTDDGLLAHQANLSIHNVF